MIPPAILTRVTFASSQTLRAKITVSTSLDTNVDCVVAAGSYYISGDGGTDDLLTVIAAAFESARPSQNHSLLPTFDRSSYKVRFGFITTGSDSSINVAGSSSDLIAALGIGSSDLSGSGSPLTLTAAYRPKFVWVPTDGILRGIETSITQRTSQRKSISGVIKSQFGGSDQVLRASFELLSEQDAYSRATAYGSEPPWPYPYNASLEAWWLQAVAGKRFRVYPHFALPWDQLSAAYRPPTPAISRELVTAGGATSITTSDVYASTHPELGVGMTMFLPWWHWHVPAKITALSDSGGSVQFTIARTLPVALTADDWSIFNTYSGEIYDRSFYECTLEDMSRRFAPQRSGPRHFSFAFNANILSRHDS